MRNASAAIAEAIARHIRPRPPITVSAWADANRILSAKQSAEPGRWRTSRNPLLREPMDAMSARSRAKEVVMVWPIQAGKALALDTPIATPTGWTTMGEIQPGNLVFGADGKPVRVIAASEVFHDHACYRVSFSDGSQIVADAGHRWQVVDLLARNAAKHVLKRRAARDAAGVVAKPRTNTSAESSAHTAIMTTEELAAAHRHHDQARFAIQLPGQLDLPTADLPLDPYLFGLWLGDGSSHYAAITSMDDEIIEAFADFDPKPHTHQSGGKATTYGLRNGLHRVLREMGVLKNKHIPAIYLRASAAQRLALLQGLMDTDGSATVDGKVEISSSYPKLVEGIYELLCSLSFKPSVYWRATKGRPSAKFSFSARRCDAPFRLARKLDRLRDAYSDRGNTSVHLRYITDVCRVDTVPTRCIAVDNDSHLFLCGKAMIPTHNTEVAVNVLGYCMDHHPGPIMVCLPAEVSMNKWIAQKLNPLIEETPAVSRALTSTASRDSSNQRTFKDFTGGQLYIEHAGSPARLKSSSVRTLIVDELDEFAANLGSGDDPLAMLEGRTSAFPTTRKTLYISTPTIAGLSRIHRLYTERSDMRTFHLECPHCRFKQNLVWNGLQWADDLSEAWYECRGCEGRIEEYQKTRLIEDADRRARAGEPGIGWVPAKPGARARGYQANALYYPLGLGPRWLDLVRMWKEVQGDAAALKTFINDRLAEPWEDPAMRQVKHELIADRVLPYRLRTAPAGVLAVTAGVDTQDNRLAVHIIGWGRKRRAWTLDYVELMGDPAAEDVWIALAELLSRPIEHAHGCAVTVEAVAIDAGGHRTEAVKNFVRSRRVRRAMAIFGAKSNNAQVLSKGTLQDVNWRGQLDKRGVMIHHVGTVAVKHMLYGLLSTDAEKPVDERVVNFSEDLPLDYFKGMVSETYNPAKNRFDKRPGARNEPLDTWVYAFAATHHPELRLHRFTESDWAAREARLLKLANPNATPAQEPEHAAESPTPAQQLHTGRPGTRRGRGGFVNRY